MREKVSIFWFRRDLRLDDNAGLYYALRSGHPVVPVFIFDKHILDDLHNKHDARLSFIRDALERMQAVLKKKGSSLHVIYGTPQQAFKELTDAYNIAAVFTNHDYEPYARERDEQIGDLLKKKDITFNTYKDQVIFDKDEILKQDQTPYTVFTPYSKQWKAKLNDFYLKPYPT